jgi:hypothetical protein
MSAPEDDLSLEHERGAEQGQLGEALRLSAFSERDA